MKKGTSDNYQIMVRNARDLFLTFDQEEIISKWDLAHDGQYLHVRYLSGDYRIDRKTAVLTDAEGQEADPYISMVIFDLLPFAAVRPCAAGTYASVSELGGIIGAGHATGLGPVRGIEDFAGRTDRLQEALEALGGTPFGKGDAGALIPVFEDFSVVFSFWDGDDEFPASAVFLFDRNALSFMHYETLWYVMGEIAKRLRHFILLKE